MVDAMDINNSTIVFIFDESFKSLTLYKILKNNSAFFRFFLRKIWKYFHCLYLGLIRHYPLVIKFVINRYLRNPTSEVHSLIYVKLLLFKIFNMFGFVEM